MATETKTAKHHCADCGKGSDDPRCKYVKLCVPCQRKRERGMTPDHIVAERVKAGAEAFAAAADRGDDPYAAGAAAAGAVMRRYWAGEIS